MASQPVRGQVNDTFILNLVPEEGTPSNPAPTKLSGILIADGSKEQDLAYNASGGTDKWFVSFCYILGTTGASAFTQAITRASGPGPASLAGTFSPTTPATQQEWPVQSGTFRPYSANLEWVYFAELSGLIPEVPGNIDSLVGDAKATVYNGNIGIVGR